MTKRAYFVGIKGVGMTALALAMQDAGWQVSGSDTTENFITDAILARRKISIYSFDQPLPRDLDLVVYSGAYQINHPTARVVSLAEALAEFTAQRTIVAVAGVGGKTTTSAMLTTMFKNLGRDVGYYIGTSDIIGLPAPGSCGSDDLYIIEADEYAISKTDKRPKFSLLHPKVLITTNILHDHPDIYQTAEDTFKVFQQLVANLPIGSTWIANKLDPLTNKIYQTTSTLAKIKFYSSSHPLYKKLNLSVFGHQNKLNALAAVLAGKVLGLKEQEALKAIASYKGAKRRQEKIAEVKDRLLYDDYGHHPNEIIVTLKSFKEAFPDHRLVVVFESHTYTRTQTLLADFAKALALADKIYLMPIFESAREKGLPHAITPASFAKEVQKFNPNVKTLTWSDAAATLALESKPKDIILTMGAGFVYKLHQQIIWILNNQ